MDLTDFDYRTVPLDSTTSRIRLVSFSRRQSDGRLFCILKAFALQHAPAFAALSYVWGDKRNKVPLPCNDNGGSVQVTKNLFNALSYFAFDISSAYQRNGFQWLWADAICINQADDKERESQVQLMRQIYEGAKQTLIWLDHSDHISDRAFKFLLRSKLSNITIEPQMKADHSARWTGQRKNYTSLMRIRSSRLTLSKLSKRL